MAASEAKNFAVLNGLSPVGDPIHLSSPDNEAQEGDPIPGGFMAEISLPSLMSKFGSIFGQSTKISLPNPPLNSGNLVFYRFEGTSNWTPIQSQIIDNQLMVRFDYYGYYQAFVPILNQPFSFSDVYVFPNPSREGDIPTLHIEVGRADRISVRIYDVAGDLVYETTISESPVAIDGKSAYEHALDPKAYKSGVYVGVVTAEKADQETIRQKFRFTIEK